MSTYSLENTSFKCNLSLHLRPSSPSFHHFIRGEILKDMEMWYMQTWVRRKLGTSGFMVGLDDIKGVFQPE